jgi:hypothetical protein
MSPDNTGCSKKSFTMVFQTLNICSFVRQCIPNVTLWPVLRKRLHLKAYKLSIVEDAERQPLVGEVSANLLRRVSRGQRNGSQRPCSRLSRPKPLLFLPSSFSVVLTRLSGPRSRPTTTLEMKLSL